MKPTFTRIGRNTQLHNLLTEESPEFFSIIKVDDNWLGQPVDREDNKDYTTAKMFVRTVKTTNDLAERAVKMATDYSQILIKNEDTRRRIIQGWRTTGGPTWTSRSQHLTIDISIVCLI